jgi:hypothetical protein
MGESLSKQWDGKGGRGATASCWIRISGQQLQSDPDSSSALLQMHTYPTEQIYHFLTNTVGDRLKLKIQYIKIIINENFAEFRIKNAKLNSWIQKSFELLSQLWALYCYAAKTGQDEPDWKTVDCWVRDE